MSEMMDWSDGVRVTWAWALGCTGRLTLQKRTTDA